MKPTWRIVIGALALIGVSAEADAGQRRYRSTPQQTQSTFDPFDYASYGWGYVPTPPVPWVGGAYTAAYAVMFDAIRTNYKYNEELYPWEALSNLDYIVPYLGTILGYAYKNNLPKICRQGPGSFRYGFSQTSFYTIDRPAEAYALNAYYSLCGGRAVSHSTLPPKGYKYPAYPYDWSYISPY